MTDFLRFPHTPHVAWLGSGKPRDDKVLAPHEVRELLADEVVVEEKVDGANLGFSTDEDGTLRAQNRGAYLDLEAPQGQWKPLRRWLAPRRHALADALFPDLMLFGEWCFAVHSIRYSRLPDWFLAFDVYDRGSRAFWSVERRNALASGLGLATVPSLGRGHYDVAGLQKLLDVSRLTGGPAEGLYVRREHEGQLVARAKVVRAEFVQAIDEHWSKRAIEENQLAPNPEGMTAWR
jgi:ATP-dependent RNA circularization protein (DNA/RNA ligase family)